MGKGTILASPGFCPMTPDIGNLTWHMAVHLLLMNGVAPLAVVAAVRLGGSSLAAPGHVFPAMIGQLALLWMWHAPPLLAAAMLSPGLHLMMQLSLLFAALWFWSSILALRGSERWRGLLALLFTSKIFCLLGVLLVFAPRSLYPEALHSASHAAGLAVPALLADQQLAGLLMLVVCPATYLTAGVVMAARWVFEIGALPVGGLGKGEMRNAAAANAG
jgi:putative membrane protein